MLKLIITDIVDRNLLRRTMENLWNLEESFRQRIRIVLVWENDGMPDIFCEDMEEWNLNVDKNVVEANMIKMNKWLKEFGVTDSDWDNYQPIYFYNEQ